MRKKIFLLITFSVFALSVSAEQNPLKDLVRITIDYLKPLSGNVIDVTEDSVIIDLGKQDGLKEGMRLKVFTKSAPFRHPVTGEIVGSTDIQTGIIEVKDALEDRSICEIIEGKVNKNSTVRFSLTQKRVLFYQDPSVDFFLGDAYFKELRSTGKVTLVEAPIEKMTLQEIVSLAKKMAVDLIIVLRSTTTAGEIRLEQSLLWKDGARISVDAVFIPQSFVTALRDKYEFIRIPREPLISFNLMKSFQYIRVTNIMDDDSPEIILASTTDLYIYRQDIKLEPLRKITFNTRKEIIWLDSTDFDKDGRDELIVTTITDDREDVFSYVYTFKDGEPKELWKTRGFLRVFNDVLLYQSYRDTDGYYGSIKKVVYDGGRFSIGATAKEIPSGLDIYGFTMTRDGEGNLYFLYIDDSGDLTILDSSGLSLQESIKLWGYTKVFEKAMLLPSEEPEKWYVKTRMVNRGNEVVVVKKEPILKEAKAIGFKNSQILGCWVKGGALTTSPLTEELSGEILDLAMKDNRLYVLQKPLLGVNLENILRGKNPFILYLHIYSIKAGG